MHCSTPANKCKRSPAKAHTCAGGQSQCFSPRGINAIKCLEPCTVQLALGYQNGWYLLASHGCVPKVVMLAK
eukprot:1156748-Pelagomonas_calceolata.AAC.2